MEERQMISPFSQIDIGLLRKYDRPGPRYTSYPTAPVFNETFTAEDYRRAIMENNSPYSRSDLYAGEEPHRGISALPEKRD
jgi:oxygen-independent coproporphyrinogen-3 oxidase